MDEGVIKTEGGGVMELGLDRPGKKNAITAAMYRVLSSALIEAAQRPDIACILITANGDAFTTGNDLADFLAPGGADAAFDFLRVVAANEKPLVAAVQGLAVGVGATLLLHCDLVYAAPDARFLTPFVALGLVPEAASSLLLPERIGHAKAAAMLMLGDPMDAQTADRAGLITAILPADQLLGHARAKAAALARQPRQALIQTRRMMRRDPAVIAERIEQEWRLFEAALQSEEASAAFASFFEKRHAASGKASPLIA